VALVRAGPGATALGAGAWQGPLPPLLRDALAASTLPYVPVSAPLPHPFGDLRECEHAGASHAQAAIRADTCVCGIAGLPGFPASALARMWGAPSHRQVLLVDTPPAGWSAVSLAALFERRPEVLLDALAGLAGERHVVLPAVLGLERHAQVFFALSALSFEVGEALGSTPSVPGWRLDRALLAALERAGVQVVHARVVGRTAREGVLESVTLAGDVAHPTLAADRFVLATGRFVGGGITASDVTDAVDVAHGGALREAKLVERALGCGVWVEHLGERFTQVQPVPLTSPVRGEAQALLGAGVHVDAELRPLDDAGRPLYRNVVACGAVLAGVVHGLGFAAGGAA
jgi:glycerol-3-phosphate dehydrogenase subunit B